MDLIFYFAPPIIESYALRAFYKLRPDVKPAPNHPYRARCAIIGAYIAFTFIKMAWGYHPNVFKLLNVPIDADDTRLNKAWKAYARKNHPDRVGLNKDTTMFVHARESYQLIQDPVRRIAYERFGPSIAQWRHCITLQDYIKRGLPAVFMYYLATFVSMMVMSLFNASYKSTAYTRFSLFFAMLTTELHLLTRPIPGFLRLLGVAKPMPFEVISFMHTVWLMLNIAIAQLGPIASTKKGIHGDSARQLKPYLDDSQKLTMKSLEEVTRALEINIKALKQSGQPKETKHFQITVITMPTPTQPLQTSNSPQLRSPGTPTRKERDRDAIISAASRGWSNRNQPSSKIALKAHSVMSPDAEFSPNRLFKPTQQSPKSSPKSPTAAVAAAVAAGAGVQSTQRRTSSSFSHVRNNSLVQNSPFKQHTNDFPSPQIDYTSSPVPEESPAMGLGLHPSRSPHRHIQSHHTVQERTSSPKPRKSKGYNLLPSAQRVTQSPWRHHSSAGSEADHPAHPSSAFSPPTPTVAQTKPLSVSKKVEEEEQVKQYDKYDQFDQYEQERPPSAGSTLSRRKTVTFEENPDIHEFEREPEPDSIATGVFSPEYDDRLDEFDGSYEYDDGEEYEEVEHDLEHDIDLYDAQNARDALVGASWEDTPPMPPPSSSLVEQHTLGRNRQSHTPTQDSAENTPELAHDYAHEGILEEYSHEYPHEFGNEELEVDTSYQAAYPEESPSLYDEEDESGHFAENENDDSGHYDENSSVIDHSFDQGEHPYEDADESHDQERTQMEDLVDSILKDELLRDSDRRKSIEELRYSKTSPLRTSTNKRQSTPTKDTTPNKMRQLGIGRPQSMPSPNLSELASHEMVKDEPMISHIKEEEDALPESESEQLQQSELEHSQEYDLEQSQEYEVEQSQEFEIERSLESEIKHPRQSKPEPAQEFQVEQLQESKPKTIQQFEPEQLQDYEHQPRQEPEIEQPEEHKPELLQEPEVAEMEPDQSSDDDLKDRSVLPELPHSSPLWALSPPSEEVAKMPKVPQIEHEHERAHPLPQQSEHSDDTPNINSLISPLLSPRFDAAGNPISPNAAGSINRRRNLREAVQEKMRKKRETEEANAALLAQREREREHEKENVQDVLTPEIRAPDAHDSQPPSPIKAAIAAVAPSPMKHNRQSFEEAVAFPSAPETAAPSEADQETEHAPPQPQPHIQAQPQPQLKAELQPPTQDEEATRDLESFAPFVSPNLDAIPPQRQQSMRGNASLKDRENAILLSRKKSRADRGERPSRRRSVSADAVESPRKKAIFRPSSGLPTPGALNEGDFGDDLDREMREIFKDSDRKYKMFEHNEVIRASSQEETVQKPKISHHAKAGDIDTGKAWKVIRRPSDMNEYSRHLKEVRNKEPLSEATGKVFVKVAGLRDVELPIPVGKQTFFCCTLDNGINHVATPYTTLRKEAPLGQEFDLILNKNLFFTLSFKCRMDEHLQPPRPQPRFRPAMATPTQPPTPSKSRSGFRSIFSSPKKEKRKAQEQQEQLERQIEQSKFEELDAVEPTEPMLNFLQKDGTFGSTRVIYNEVAPRCQGRMVELILPLEGKFTKNDGSVTKCIVGKLVLHVLGIPTLPGVVQKDLPSSLEHTVKTMKEMQWHKKKICQSVLTQLGGGVTSWRRRMYSLVGGRIIVFNEVTKRAIATIDLATAKAVLDCNNASAEAVENGWVDEGDASVERSFMLVLQDQSGEEKLHFFSDTDEDKEVWVKELRGIIGRIPPKPLWAQALEERQSPPPSQLPQRTTSNVVNLVTSPNQHQPRQSLSPIKASPMPSAHALHTSSRKPPPAPSTGKGMAQPGLMASIASRQDSLPTPTKNKNGPNSVQSSTKGLNQSTYDKKSFRGSIFSSLGSRSATPSRSFTPDTSLRSTTKSFFGFK
ncbi:hypothetical protein E3P84_02834 [Wallemia ichthyophaga]|nr:hypothetical protein E3P95_00516 [Wallemia ichthyophaga]TIB04191.1 hypothetical protein E3P94_00755 [Wallemia ichthyophaga]TIB31737.1 hypothetical protein E3P84_02834 [Wallemia ichthyophaga]TIB39314.1 hypothetical protein E3P83_03559 [Wallemia ichthyophaga]